LRGSRGIGGQCGAPRPTPALGRCAKAALVIGVSRDPLFGPDFTGSLEGVGVIGSGAARTVPMPASRTSSSVVGAQPTSSSNAAIIQTPAGLDAICSRPILTPI